MEIELKYAIPDRETADRIWNDPELKAMEEKSTREINEFRGTYYDTEDYLLFKHDIAFRMRKEGKKLVASLKWNGETTGALHKREELNMNLGEEEIPESPDPDIFCESEEGHLTSDLLKGRKLKGMIQVNVTRKDFRIDTGNSIAEISLDDGKIITDKGTEDILELEIELYNGSQEDIEDLGEQLEEKYGLTAEKNSKFARGLRLLGVI